MHCDDKIFQCVNPGKGIERGIRVLEVLKGAGKTIGIKQTLKAVENRTANTVFIARDADEKVTRSLKDLCRENSVEIIYADTMKQLGKACGIEVGAAAACTLK